jgi:hypothetical protein
MPAIDSLESNAAESYHLTVYHLLRHGHGAEHIQAMLENAGVDPRIARRAVHEVSTALARVRSGDAGYRIWLRYVIFHPFRSGILVAAHAVVSLIVGCVAAIAFWFRLGLAPIGDLTVLAGPAIVAGGAYYLAGTVPIYCLVRIANFGRSADV